MSTLKRGRPRENPDELKREELIEKQTDSVISVLTNSCKRKDAADVPEFVAYELIDLSEWICDIDIRSQVIENVLSSSFSF